MSIVEQNLAKTGLSLPNNDGKLKKGGGNLPYKIFDDLLFITGLEPTGDDNKPAFVGRCGKEFTTQEGYKAGRLVGINMLSYIKDALGSLDRVDYFIKVTALVSGTDDFIQREQVADGFTDLMNEVFGERGMHTRATYGATVLNNNVPIICDALIKIRD